MSGLLESTKYVVLVALAAEPAYGVAIRQRIIADTMGVYLRDSTLYATLKSLANEGLIEELPSPDRQQRVWQLTEKGQQRLELEARRQKRAVELILQRLRLRL